jgi:hypothetical protein
MSTQPSNYLSNITNNIGDNYKSYIIMTFTFLILIFIVGYMIYLRRLNNAECNYMNNLYSTIDGNIIPITANDPDCSGNLYDYYIKTAYNACSGGSYKNDYVNICNLVAVLKQGVRCLDFQIFSNGTTPVVATSTINDYYVKYQNSAPATAMRLEPTNGLNLQPSTVANSFPIKKSNPKSLFR